MTKKDFLRELKSYFPDIEWNESAESRVLMLLGKYHVFQKDRVVIKQIYVDREVVVEGQSATEPDFQRIAEEICKLHNISLEQLKANSPKWAYAGGKRAAKELVDARQEFVRRLFNAYPHTSKLQTSRWLGYVCHSSVFHLIKKRKL